MHKQQLKALIDYHKKAETAYREIGNIRKAENAKQARKRFEKELKMEK